MPFPGVPFALLQEVGDAAAYTIGAGVWIFIIAMIVIQIAAWWKMFEKAGKPGWAAIIPIYNLIVLLQVGGKPLWWIILFIIPLVNIIFWILLSIAVANNFGKGALFGIGLFVLGFIFYPILGFGDAKYQAAT